jgi:thiol:disulfide interchange protein DsbD
VRGSRRLIARAIVPLAVLTFVATRATLGRRGGDGAGVPIGGAALVGAQSGGPAGPAGAELTPLVGSDGVGPGDTAHLALQVKLPDGFHTNSNRPRDPTVIPITLAFDAPPRVPPDIEAVELVFPAATDIKSAVSDQPLTVFTGTFVIGVTVKVAPTAAPGDARVDAKLRYQACDETQCYFPKTLPVAWTLRIVPRGARTSAQHKDLFDRIAFGHGEAPGAPAAASSPQAVVGSSPRAAADSVRTAGLDEFTALGTTTGYMGRADFLTFIHNAEQGVTEKGMFEGRGPLAILLIVFLGGLALNLTPCVLPMIPINLAIIGAGVKAGSRVRGFLLGGAYGAAMAVVYGVLGLVVILTAGTFGTINAYWWFNAAIAALFIALALAMFDVITIDFSRFSTRFSVSDGSRGSFMVAFGMGAVAALLAGACVAPVVVQVVLFSSDLYAKGAAAALALPFVLGLGMAVPWPFAGAGIAALPRPGAWMVRIKQVFGVVILATAVYYGYEAYGLLSSRWVDAAEVNASVQEKLKEGWHPLDEGLATAAREHRPVLVDMWATWCRDCLTMDKTTLEDQDVVSALSGYVKIKFQADNPEDPGVQQVMRRFNATGLPTYVILRPQ